MVGVNQSEHSSNNQSEHNINQVTESETDNVLAMAWRPGHQEVAVAGAGGNIRVFDLDTGRLVTSMDTCHVDRINDVAYNARGDLLASASDDCTVRVWTTDTGQFHSSLNVHR